MADDLHRAKKRWRNRSRLKDRITRRYSVWFCTDPSIVKQQTPTFSAPRISILQKTIFSQNELEVGLGMIQMYFIYCTLLFYDGWVRFLEGTQGLDPSHAQFTVHSSPRSPSRIQCHCCSDPSSGELQRSCNTRRTSLPSPLLSGPGQMVGVGGHCIRDIMGTVRETWMRYGDSIVVMYSPWLPDWIVAVVELM